MARTRRHSSKYRRWQILCSDVAMMWDNGRPAARRTLHSKARVLQQDMSLLAAAAAPMLMELGAVTAAMLLAGPGANASRDARCWAAQGLLPSPPPSPPWPPSPQPQAQLLLQACPPLLHLAPQPAAPPHQ